MSELNYLEKLLDGTEVEWKALGDVTSVLRGKRLTKNLLSAEEKFPVFHGGLEPLGYYNKSNRPANTVMIINVGASAGTVGYSTVDFWSSDGCFCLEHNELLNNRFLYFALIGYQSLLKSKVRVAGIPTLDAIVVNKLLIPIPCPENPEKSLAIQSAIVRILDKFTALTAELTAELTARKKQYNYYRDQLLSFEEGAAPFYPLGQKEVGEFIRGGSFQKKDFTKSGIGCIHYGQIFTHYGTYANKTKTFVSESLAQKCRKAKTGNLVIATTSENDDDVCKAVAWLGTEDIAVSSDACIYRHNLNPKYVSYFFQTESFQSQKRQYITGTKVRRVNADNLAKILIPVPSQEEQTRIVDILDKFDLLTSSISQGLPREIELRQKQYEYYRDLLFSFPKPDSVTN
ncbi:restriction endonuclease subunit S [Atlantibacter hermannii]|uniref:restriction endonuclease subunit S n=1 Tax=Atlantibacter hermannii TaxID=565 RepID=UPI0028AC6B9D|nr:restriction endonuclease subunit S [Atlantibacter hermannii]